MMEGDRSIKQMTELRTYLSTLITFLKTFLKKKKISQGEQKFEKLAFCKRLIFISYLF